MARRQKYRKTEATTWGDRRGLRGRWYKGRRERERERERETRER